MALDSTYLHQAIMKLAVSLLMSSRYKYISPDFTALFRNLFSQLHVHFSH